MALQIQEYIVLSNTGNYVLTEKGVAAVNLVRQQNTAWETNRDFVLAWFKGMNVNPSPAAVLEFADELQEYSKLYNKKTVLSPELYTGEFIKWNYYAQESRNNIQLPSGTFVNNIVDDTLIEDRILKLKNNTPGFFEYFDRNLSFDYSNIFNDGQNIQFVDLNFYFGSTFFSSGEYQSVKSREEVLAWFKGVNLQPSIEVINTYRNYIQAYLLDSRKTIDTNIEVGIFLVK